MAQSGSHLTNAQGTRLYDTDHSLKVGPRGPVLLQDHHLREKIMHFDHERIPERVVHARGGAHGVFQSYGTAASVTKAGFLGPDVETPVFVRFSTVVGSRGSADTVRDTRGFATKFYSEGVFDLVGNNIPVFFIQDAIKFPDVVHAAKPHPDREIRRPRAPTTPSGTSSRCTPRPPITPSSSWATGHPALVPDDGGLRRPHLPPRQRGGDDPGQVPLEAQAGRALPGVGRGAAHQRQRPRLPPP